MGMYDYPERRRSSPGCASIIGSLLLMVVGAGVVFVLVFMFGMWRTGDRFMEGLGSIFNAPQPTAQVDVRSLVIRQIRGASELTTSIFAMEAVVPTSRERTVAGVVVGNTTLLYIAYGEVRAGVDLSEIQAEDVQVISDTIHIRLPPPRI